MPETPATVASPPMMGSVMTATLEVIVHKELMMAVEVEAEVVEAEDLIDIAEQLEGENSVEAFGDSSLLTVFQQF